MITAGTLPRPLVGLARYRQATSARLLHRRLHSLRMPYQVSLALLSRERELTFSIYFPGDVDDNVICDTIKAVAKTEAFLPLAFRHCDDETIQKAAQKVRRAFERLRRAGLKAYETLSSSSQKAQRDGLEALNRRVVDVLSSTLTSVSSAYIASQSYF